MINLNVCKNPGVSSILKPNFDFLYKFRDSERFEIIKEVNLEANTIDSIGITNVDFVKIDIQGSRIRRFKRM